jgi:hypothetical protein
MAVVDISWVFYELVFVDTKVGVRWNTVGIIVIVVICLGPSNSHLQDLKFVQKSNLLPFALIFGDWNGVADVLEIAIARIIIVSSLI